MAASANSNGHAAPVGSDFLTLRQVVKLAGCHENTARRASNTGELKVYRLPSGHRRWARSDIYEWLGIENPGEPEQQPASQILIYARVSSHKQSRGIEKGELNNDLGRQIERLKKVADEKYECTNPIVFLDTASGLSFTRKDC
jgi:putative resolvase